MPLTNKRLFLESLASKESTCARQQQNEYRYSVSVSVHLMRDYVPSEDDRMHDACVRNYIYIHIHVYILTQIKNAKA